jgi:hypothetical protein
VANTSTYDITTSGTYGGSGRRGVDCPNPATGGLGAAIGGDFAPNAWEVLIVAVGGRGVSFYDFGGGGGGGGGGTFVSGPNAAELLIAAGGSGASFYSNGGSGPTGPGGSSLGESGYGGGWFDGGSAQVLVAGENTDNGVVNIALAPNSFPVPAPVFAALLATGILGLGLLRRRRPTNRYHAATDGAGSGSLVALGGSIAAQLRHLRFRRQ